MAAAGGAASIITQVQQGGPAPLNTSLAGKKELDMKNNQWMLSVSSHSRHG
jgi:hypothetical protein